MKSIITVLLLLSTSFVIAQKIVLPKTNHNQAEEKRITIDIDPEEQGLFIQQLGIDYESGYMSLREYKAPFDAIDSIHVAIDKKQTAVGLHFFSCDKKLQETTITLIDFIVDDPSFEDNIKLGNWSYAELGAIQDVADQLSAYISSTDTCASKDIKELHPFYLQSSESGVDDIKWDGNDALCQITKDAVKAHFLSCLERHEKDSIDLVSLDMKFAKDGAMNVDYLFLIRTYLNVDEAVQTRLRDCMASMDGWTNLRKNQWGDLELSYIFSIHSDQLDSVGLAIFEEIKLESDIRKHQRGVTVDIYTQAQKDSLLEEAFFQALSGTNNNEESIYKVVEQMPVLVDTEYFNSMKKILEHMFPDTAFDIVIKQIIDTDGTVADYEFLKCNAHLGIRNAVQDFFKRSPPVYSPGKQRGKPVKVEVVSVLKK